MKRQSKPAGRPRKMAVKQERRIIETIDGLNRAINLSKAARVASAILGQDDGMCILIRTAMDAQLAELTEVKDHVREMWDGRSR